MHRQLDVMFTSFPELYLSIRSDRKACVYVMDGVTACWLHHNDSNILYPRGQPSALNSQ